MYTFKILGMRDSTARSLEEKVQMALLQLHVHANIEHVENVDLFLDYKLSQIPALMVDDRILLTGNEKDSSEIEKIIFAYLQGK